MKRDWSRPREPISQPGIIAKPGAYCLESDICGAGQAAITVDAPNVTIDLAGHTIRCVSQGAADTTFGIYGTRSAGGLVVRGGRIVDCYGGVSALSADNVRIEQIAFAGLRYIGVNVGGRGARVLANSFAAIGGERGEAYAVAINIYPGARDCLVEGNEIRDLHRQERAAATLAGEGVGILVGGEALSCTIRGNRISNEVESGSTIAIWIAENARDHHIVDNEIVGFRQGIISAGTATIIADNRLTLRQGHAESLAIYGDSGRATGNLIVNYVTPVGGKMEAAGNVVE